MNTAVVSAHARRAASWIGISSVTLSLFVGGRPARAQTSNPEDGIIDTIRPLSDIGASDQGRIARWIEWEIDNFQSFKSFRERFRSNYTNGNNSAAFRRQLAMQTARIGKDRLVAETTAGDVAHGIVQVLLDIDGTEIIPGLIAGLASKDPRARYLSAKGISAQRSAIIADRSLLDETVQALRNAGLTEGDPVVLGKIYEALAIPSQAATVAEAYFLIFDQRQQARRSARSPADQAEIYAFEFFRDPTILSALSNDQKATLVRALAVFLRVDAERYAREDLDYDEMDALERRLDGEETIVQALVGSGVGGDIKGVLSAGGHGRAADVVAEAYKWVGDPSTQQPGALSSAPWTVPLGAP